MRWQALASLTRSESRLKASEQPGFMGVCQLTIFPLLECGCSSCETGGKSSSPDVSSCTSSEECHLLDGGDRLVSGLMEMAVEVAEDGFTSAWGVGVKEMCSKDGEDGPIKGNKKSTTPL